MSNRQSDTRGEKALGLFLDRYFYPRLCMEENFVEAQRIFDVEAQKRGTDILIYNPNGTVMVVDEKAQLHYINEPRPTFAFEVSFYNENTRSISDGWFISDSNKTDAYLLVWIDSSRTNQINRLVEEDFNEVTTLLIAKKRIIQYLSSLEYSIKLIKVLADKMRTDNKGNVYKLSPDAFIYYSNNGYDEKPINVVINRETLYKLAYGVYKVSRTDFKKML